MGQVLVLLGFLWPVPRCPLLRLLPDSRLLNRPHADPLSLLLSLRVRLLRRENRLGEVICGLRSVGSLGADVGVFSGPGCRVYEVEVESARLLRGRLLLGHILEVGRGYLSLLPLEVELQRGVIRWSSWLLPQKISLWRGFLTEGHSRVSQRFRLRTPLTCFGRGVQHDL